MSKCIRYIHKMILKSALSHLIGKFNDKQYLVYQKLPAIFEVFQLIYSSVQLKIFCGEKVNNNKVECFKMFGEKALELVKELKRSRDSSLPPYNEDCVRQVLDENESFV